MSFTTRSQKMRAQPAKSANSKVELTEDELRHVSGGAFDTYMIFRDSEPAKI